MSWQQSQQRKAQYWQLMQQMMAERWVETPLEKLTELRPIHYQQKLPLLLEKYYHYQSKQVRQEIKHFHELLRNVEKR